LEEKSATAEILRVISNSPVELQTVFDTVVVSAATLCGAAFAGLHRIEDGSFIDKLKAQEVTEGAVIFRSGDKLYIVDGKEVAGK